MKTDILLVFPPWFYPHMPYIALPILKAYLEKNGIIAHQIDLNILAYEYFLSEKYVKEAYDNVIEKVKNDYKREPLPRKLELTSSQEMKYVIAQLKNAIASIRSKKKYLSLDKSQMIIDLALDIVSDAYFPTELTFSGLKMLYSNRSSKQVYTAISDCKTNMFLSFYERTIPSIFVNYQPKYIGISITVPDQIIPAFSLCKVIRKLAPKKKIILGGNIVTRLESFFSRDNCLRDFYDFCIFGEGEKSLLSLLQEEKNVFPSVDLNELPCPSFEELPLEKYFEDNLVLPILASRRCYWDKCLFCSISSAYSPGYRKANSKKVVDDIEELMKKHNTKFFKFVDDAASPHLLKEIAIEVLRRGLEIYWEAYTILERDFIDKKFCKTLFAAGCRWLYFGLETANTETARNMNKSIRNFSIEKLLETVKIAGINIHVWVIIGYPGETKTSINKTIRFIVHNKHLIDSVEINQFALTKGAPIIEKGISSTFKIKPLIREDEDLALIYDYKTSNGISQEEAQDLTKKIRKYLGYINVVRSANLLSIRLF